MGEMLHSLLFACSFIAYEKKEKSSERIACMEKNAVSVLLKPFIIGNEGCHTTDAYYNVATSQH